MKESGDLRACNKTGRIKLCSLEHVTSHILTFEFGLRKLAHGCRCSLKSWGASPVALERRHWHEVRFWLKDHLSEPCADQ